MAKKTAPPTARQKRLFKEFMGHAQAAFKIVSELYDIDENQRLFRMRGIRVYPSKRARKATK